MIKILAIIFLLAGISPAFSFSPFKIGPVLSWCYHPKAFKDIARFYDEAGPIVAKRYYVKLLKNGSCVNIHSMGLPARFLGKEIFEEYETGYAVDTGVIVIVKGTIDPDSESPIEDVYVAIEKSIIEKYMDGKKT